VSQKWSVVVDTLPGGGRVVAAKRESGRIVEYGPQFIVDPPSWLRRICGDTLERRVKLAADEVRHWCVERNAAEAFG